MTIDKALKYANEYLKDNNILDYDSCSRILLEFVSGFSYTQLVLHREDEIDDLVYNNYLELLEKRAKHIPLQYLTNAQEFMGLDFYVDENVLIPRQDTEILVLEALKHCDGKTVLDMCTGSGCIITSIMKLGNAKKGVGVDISKKALNLAKKNAKNNSVNVEFIESDLFTSVDGKYDIIVSNPPYVTEEEYAVLDKEVTDYEPILALVASDNGLYFYKELAKKAKEFLNAEGLLIVEIGCNQAEQVSKIFSNNGFSEVKVIKDYAGLDRVVKAKIK